MNLNDLGIHSEIKTKPANCESHGDFVSRNVFRSVWSGCPQCAADRQAAEQRESEEKAAIERHRAWQKRLGESGIPERFHTRTLESYNARSEGQKRALDFATSYAAEFSRSGISGRSAIFCGKPGTGKTHLAAGIGLKVMAGNGLVLFTTVQRMVRRVKDAWRKDATESESDVIRLLVEPDLLILDEIGVQFGTEFEKNLMFDILNERYEKRRPTLLLSNLMPADVKLFLGERVYDRLREDGGVCVPFDWESHRGRA